MIPAIAMRFVVFMFGVPRARGWIARSGCGCVFFKEENNISGQVFGH